jgi:hypothetical protein
LSHRGILEIKVAERNIRLLARNLRESLIWYMSEEETATLPPLKSDPL